MRHFPLLAVAVLVVLARPVGAATVVVPPGDGTLQAAIDAAEPGDTLIANGVYSGAVVIDKRLRLVAPKDGSIQIDGGCVAAVGLTIAATGVTVKGGPIHVYGATTTGIAIHDSNRVKTGVTSTTNTCGSATTGLEITNSRNVTMKGGNVFYFTTTAIRLADLPAQAAVRVSGFSGMTATTGVAIENVAPGAGPKGAKVIVEVVMTNGVSNGIVLTAADGVVILRSDLGYTTTGITIDAESDNNVIRRTAVGPAVNDAGNNTCWQGNNGYPDQCS